MQIFLVGLYIKEKVHVLRATLYDGEFHLLVSECEERIFSKTYILSLNVLDKKFMSIDSGRYENR